MEKEHGREKNVCGGVGRRMFMDDDCRVVEKTLRVCVCVSFLTITGGRRKSMGGGVWVDDDCQRQRRLRECKFMYLCVECVEWVCVCVWSGCVECVCVCVCGCVGGVFQEVQKT
jgi:hypothetical protein